MELQHIFRLVFSLLLLGIISVSALIVSARPGCTSICGNVSISYPFGMDPDCYYNEWFSITCNTSTNPHKPFLTRHNNAEILNISLDEGIVLINGDTCTICDGNDSPFTSFDLTYNTITSINLTYNPHLLYSDTRNRFVALGCGVLATIAGNEDEIVGGCISICKNISEKSKRNRDGGGCYGIGCCESTIPDGLKRFTLTVENTSDRRVHGTCKHAFLVYESWLLNTKFSNPFKAVPKKAPLALEWGFLGNDTCGVCGKHANCDWNSTYQKFLCKCAGGYAGNPYLECQDIDECNMNLHTCAATAQCINRPGSFLCSCLSGYHGDGYRNGNGCVKIQLATPAIIGIGAGIGFLLLSVGVFCLYKVAQIKKTIRLKRKNFERNGGLLLQKKMSANGDGAEKSKHFTSTELEIATDKYNEDRIIGRGGQGTVYKGMLTDGRIIAVKKSKNIIDGGQLEPFINEVFILSQIDHRNVVKLFGCCLETEVPLLVYEFVPNGTLSDAIHDQNEEFPISWEIRLHIATDIAGAISYLHSATSVPIYHRDIKSTNILLDEKFRAKLSDFGSSRLVSTDQTHLSTQVKGTFGYFDPEYFRSSKFTEKSDVYSFGVVLAELLTGKKPIFTITPGEKISLTFYFISCLEENRLFDILDARLVKEGERDELITVANLANRCLDLDGRKRPTMKEVAVTLEGIVLSKGHFPTEPSPVSSFQISQLNSITSSGFHYMDWSTSNSTDTESFMHNIK